MVDAALGRLSALILAESNLRTMYRYPGGPELIITSLVAYERVRRSRADGQDQRPVEHQPHDEQASGATEFPTSHVVNECEQPSNDVSPTRNLDQEDHEDTNLLHASVSKHVMETATKTEEHARKRFCRRSEESTEELSEFMASIQTAAYRPPTGMCDKLPTMIPFPTFNLEMLPWNTFHAIRFLSEEVSIIHDCDHGNFSYHIVEMNTTQSLSALANNMPEMEKLSTEWQRRGVSPMLTVGLPRGRSLMNDSFLFVLHYPL